MIGINEQVESSIRTMATGASEQEVQNAIGDWSWYFLKMRIEMGEQLTEFESIVRARLASGIVSIAAPNDKAY